MDIKKRLAPSGFIALGLFIFLLYLSIIITLQSKPISDFDFYYQTALALENESVVNVFYKYFQAPGYPYFLCFLFKISGSSSIFIPQIFNALMLTLLNFLLAKYNFIQNGYLRLFGLFVLAFNMNYFPMVSVLCSEIPYAFLFGGGFLLMGIFIEKVWESPAWSKKKMLTLGGTGIVLGASQIIRPVTTPFLLLFTIVFLLGASYFFISRRKSLSHILRILLPVWSGFVGTAVVLYYLSGYGLTSQPLQNGLWNIYVGFNAEAKGRWNLQDSHLIGLIGHESNWNAQKVNAKLFIALKERVRKNWVNQFRNLPDKLSMLLDPTGIPQWALEKSSLQARGLVYKLGKYFHLFNLFIAGLSFLGLLSIVRKRKVSSAEFLVMLLTATVLANLFLHACLLEIQGRYVSHLMLILFWCFPFHIEFLWQRYLSKRTGSIDSGRKI